MQKQSEKVVDEPIIIGQPDDRQHADGVVLIDPTTSAVLRIIAPQYNPDTLNRTLQVKGPLVETIKVESEIDARD